MSLKSFDIFRKINTEDDQSTKTGGFLTIIAFIIGGLLLFQSLKQHYTDKYTTSLIIQNDDNPMLPVRIDMTLTHAPCHVINLKFHDQVEFQQNGLQSQLNLTRVGKDGTAKPYVRNNNHDEERNDLKKAVEQGQGCRLSGTMEIPKTPGFLKLQMTSNSEIVHQVPEVVHQISARFRLDSLQFGRNTQQIQIPMVYQSEAIRKYILDLEGKLSQKAFVMDMTGEQSPIDFISHIKIIPVRYGQSKKQHKFVDKYRYSIRGGKTSRQQFTPSITFLVEIEPINIVYHKVDRSTYQLIVKIFAIIGGVFATVGVINGIFQWLLGLCNIKM